MSRAAKIVPVVMLSMMVGFFLPFMVSGHWALLWMIMHLLTILAILVCMDTRGGLIILNWIIPHTQVVCTMDSDGEVRHVLAYGEYGQVLHAHRYWLSEVGNMKLHPNGYVSGPSFVHFWEPIHPEQLVAMRLTYDSLDFDKLAKMHWLDRDDYRLMLQNQIKLSHESHI